jgi:hypothetical protein
VIEQAIDNAWAFVLFSVVVLGLYAFALLILLFVGLLLRHAWRWLASANWRDVVVSVERKALGR